jgi:hypothetical protein
MDFSSLQSYFNSHISLLPFLLKPCTFYILRDLNLRLNHSMDSPLI